MRILFVVDVGTEWLGGVYYVRNMIYQLLTYQASDIKIYLYLSKEIAHEFSELVERGNIYLIYKKPKTTHNALSSILDRLRERIYGALDNRTILLLSIKYRIDFVFPYFSEGFIYRKLLSRKCITWIADFQHVHYPKFFSKDTWNNREELFTKKAKRHYKLVLSSKDAYNDYSNLYPDYLEGVYVIPFVSWLEKNMVLSDEIEETKKKYDIVGNYFIISNQFWMHKNHLLVFEAVSKMKNRDVTIVCTGKLSDYRNKGYANMIKNYLFQNKIEKNIRLLGIIDRNDQIQLLKGAISLIQPSLFEGWGTCVEDAKTLDKITVLSDIGVHYEQANEKSVIFPRNDSGALANILDDLWAQYRTKKPEWKYQLADAKKYGRRFYNMLVDKR